MKPFDKEKLLKIKEITTLDHDGQKKFVDPANLKLVLISSQLCWEDPKGYFIPIERISKIKELFDTEDKPVEKKEEDDNNKS